MLFWYFHYFIKLNILFQYICYRYVVYNICYHFETEYVVILLLEMSYFHHFIHRSTLFIIYLPVKAARCILQYTLLLINFIPFMQFLLHLYYNVYIVYIAILYCTKATLLFWYFHYFIKLNILFQYICYRLILLSLSLKRIHDALTSRLVVNCQLGLATRFR